MQNYYEGFKAQQFVLRLHSENIMYPIQPPLVGKGLVTI